MWLRNRRHAAMKRMSFLRLRAAFLRCMRQNGGTTNNEKVFHVRRAWYKLSS